MDIMKKIEMMLNSGEPVIRTFFLIRHIFLPFILCGFYILFSTTIGPAMMKNRKAFELRIPMIIYNFSIVFTYVVTLSIGIWNLQYVPLNMICVGYPTYIIEEDDITYKLLTLFWVIYMLKYVELFDTVFFVLRKRNDHISFLHVMHHAVIPIFFWLVARTETSGLQILPLILNSFVHIIMYSYYGLSAMGPHVQKYLWWKKHLTQIQMIQFILIITFGAIVVPLSGCPMGPVPYVMNILLVPTFLYLFYGYYKNTFQYRRIE